MPRMTHQELFAKLAPMSAEESWAWMRTQPVWVWRMQAHNRVMVTLRKDGIPEEAAKALAREAQGRELARMFRLEADAGFLELHEPFASAVAAGYVPDDMYPHPDAHLETHDSVDVDEVSFAVDFRNGTLGDVAPTLQTKGNSLNSLPGILTMPLRRGRS